ncbi:MAG: hypothetical protein J5764_01505 [Bacteroidales bacterium]|nr:hypothetical protein [Bacteroidales bacterium]
MTSFRSYSTAFKIFLAALLVCSCSSARYAPNTAYPAPKINRIHAGHLESVTYPTLPPDGPRERRMFVYLPEGYYESQKRYPVLYMLHGARGNELSWIERADMLDCADSLVQAGKMEETILVFNNLNPYKDDADYAYSRCKNAFESFFGITGVAQSEFMETVVHTVDSLYRTIPDKEHRAIAGMSLGGMDSIHLTATHPQSFGYVGLFSPLVHSVVKSSPRSSFYKNLKQKQVAQFENPPALYIIMIGKTDIFHPIMECWRRDLAKRGYNYEYVLSPGGHEWYNWKDYGIIFLQRLWK